ncbi:MULTISPECIES: MarR family transcriptional regulator [unclassified Bacillus (in: firmicutes)]|uniref:MarR family transcriptional regulator n=1 Tax=unclassified Bacillus (in: firmicutes) TaxID=185979 RepID=UPI00227ECC69|nr:MarR family transcriptional regulator [Bacillus sp. S20C3]MCY8204388.1 MarR family transcriptional regulator [Bacillus sp. N12A5]MCY8288572.1 MarR family transcriptional regulator [Bacillus sp. N13C7]MCY8638074.1 MarR family transcriptional regulator [Bacillus sp. S17B2]MCY8719691.1 MarR family transcriptional regulator [Bacillus sp. S10C12M]MCY9142419.1 MarR family transcriptional regulator [Bacillus sp. T9C1]
MDNSIHDELFQAIQQFALKRDKRVWQKVQIPSSKHLDHLKKDWTLTQLHIVSCIHTSKNVNNSFLAARLHISKAAVSKAIQALLKHNIITVTKKPGNKKEIFYTLTESGKELAGLHERLHQKAKERYKQLFNEFSIDELKTVTAFINLWIKHM